MHSPGAERLFLRAARPVIRRRSSPTRWRRVLTVGWRRPTTAGWRCWWLRSVWSRRRIGGGRRVFKRQGTLQKRSSAIFPWMTMRKSGKCGGRTNISSAVSDGLFSSDMVSDSDRMFERLDLLPRAGSRNGLRERGRGGGSSKGEAGLRGTAGDAARLRKGLFEERLSSNPADC